MLRDGLERIGSEFTAARGRPFAQDPLARFLRSELPLALAHALRPEHPHLLVRGSAGRSAWAAVPWVAVLDPAVTTSAQEGFYVVYLFSADMERLYLCLLQGTEAVLEEFGPAAGPLVLRERARFLERRVGEREALPPRMEIDLASPSLLPRGYEAAQVAARRYDLAALPGEAALWADLEAMLRAYSALVHLGGLTATEDLLDQAGTASLAEARNLALSARLERRPDTRRRVLRHRGAACEGCGLDPARHMALPPGLDPGRAPLDVHHLIPRAALRRPERFAYHVPDDFAVLCPTCHRLAHLQDDPSDLDELRGRLRVRYWEEVT